MGRSQAPHSSWLLRRSSKSWFIWGGILAVLILAIVLWNGFSNLQTSTLNLSFNRLTSLPFSLEIETPGTLSISAGPSAFSKDARVLAMVIKSPTAQPVNSSAPFVVSPPYEVIYNMTNPNNPQELILAVLFPEEHFVDQEQAVAELPFTTTAAGEFEVKNIFLGNLPTF